MAGISVSSAGDVNGDGFGDILIGAPGGDPHGKERAGETYIVFGKQGPFPARMDLASLDRTRGLQIRGIEPYSDSGVSVSSAGDVNGDGFDDILIGASSSAPNGINGAGQSYLVFGRAFTVVRGDVNHDGAVDNLDITSFIKAASVGGQTGDSVQQAAFHALVPHGTFAAADTNADRSVDNLDITPFINILSGMAVGAAVTAPQAEPTSTPTASQS